MALQLLIDCINAYFYYTFSCIWASSWMWTYICLYGRSCLIIVLLFMFITQQKFSPIELANSQLVVDSLEDCIFCKPWRGQYHGRIRWMSYYQMKKQMMMDLTASSQTILWQLINLSKKTSLTIFASSILRFLFLVTGLFLQHIKLMEKYCRLCCNVNKLRNVVFF